MRATQPKTALVAVDLIDIDDQALRHDPEDDSILELAQDIAQKGLIQPVGVTAKESGRFQLRWGGRRLAAHKRLRRPDIWARIWDNYDISVKALAVVENLQRKQMTLAEEVDAVQFMHEVEEKSIEQIAAAISKTRSWVLNRLMVPELAPHLRDPLLAGDLPLSHVEVIARVPDPGAQSYLVAQALQNRWNKSQLKTIADCYTDPNTIQPPALGGTPGVAPQTPQQPFMYTCEMCGEKGRIEEFTLVRIHKENEGCRTVADRPDHQSDSVDGVDRDPGEHRNGPDETSD
jgi:ParB/RepB/Spo0J family partition protein